LHSNTAAPKSDLSVSFSLALLFNPTHQRILFHSSPEPCRLIQIPAQLSPSKNAVLPDKLTDICTLPRSRFMRYTALGTVHSQPAGLGCSFPVSPYQMN
jgi:hypothetical protein